MALNNIDKIFITASPTLPTANIIVNTIRDLEQQYEQMHMVVIIYRIDVDKFCLFLVSTLPRLSVLKIVQTSFQEISIQGFSSVTANFVTKCCDYSLTRLYRFGFHEILSKKTRCIVTVSIIIGIINISLIFILYPTVVFLSKNLNNELQYR